MTETRLFVGNLPKDITEEDLKSEFQSYGKILSIDIKSKQISTNHSVGENSWDNTENMHHPVNTFAFIRLIINDNDLQLCLREFREYEYHGCYLNVCVAKEHFLTKLQREREHNPANERNTDSSLPSAKPTSSNISINYAITSTDGNDSFDAPIEVNQIPNNIKKKKLLNCRNEINEQNKFILKTTADIKRKNALTLKVQTYENQQLIIKKALTLVDHSDNNKIITFDYDGRDDGCNTNKKPKLFDDENDDQYVLDTYDKDFSIKEEFQGETGEKLMQLQSKFNNDERFRLSKAFLGDENDKRKNNNLEKIQNENDESTWQYQIIESITGKPLDQTTEIHIKNKVQPMLRYDPTIESHSKYLNSSKTKYNDVNIVNGTGNDVKSNLNKKLKIQIDSDITLSMPNENVATREQFYKFSEHLSNSLNHSSKGFSLLSMFGGNGYDANGIDKEINVKNNLHANNMKEIFNFNTIDSNKSDINPFDYDHHDNTIMDNKPTEFTRKESMQAKNNTTNLTSSKCILNKKIKHEHLFLNADDDVRLKEGELFFIGHLRHPNKNIKDNNTMEESMKFKKEELRNIIKKKIKRTARNRFSTGGKKFNTFRKVIIQK